MYVRKAQAMHGTLQGLEKDSAILMPTAGCTNNLTADGSNWMGFEGTTCITV